MKYRKPELYEIASALSIVLSTPPGDKDSLETGDTVEGLELGLDD